MCSHTKEDLEDLLRHVVKKQFNISYAAEIKEQFNVRFRTRFDEEFGAAFEPRFNEIGDLVWKKTAMPLHTQMVDTVPDGIYESILKEIKDMTLDAVENNLMHYLDEFPMAELIFSSNESVRSCAFNVMMEHLFHEKLHEMMDGEFRAKFAAMFESAFNGVFPEFFDKKFDEVYTTVVEADSSKAA